MSQSSLARTPDNFVREEARRSTRIERSVPLIVFGQNRTGEPFVERTVSTSVNLHGCRYPSRHEYGVGTWVTLQVVGLSVEPKPAAVRAQVRSVHASQSTRELQQVGVELESPANVWGIVTPPQDWVRLSGTTTSMPQMAVAAAPALEAPPISTETADSEEPPSNLEPKLAEVATFPSPSPVTAKPPAPKLAEAPKPQRVVITPDGLINALQGKLQQAAEKAVQAAVAKQVDEAVERAVQTAVAKQVAEAADSAVQIAIAKQMDQAAGKAVQSALAKQLDEAVQKALTAIDDVRQSSVRIVQQFIPASAESTGLPSRDEFAAAVGSQWKEQMETYRGQAEQLALKLEKQASELKRQLERSHEFLEKMNHELEPQVHARLNEAVSRAASDFDGAAARTVDRRYELLLGSTQSILQEALLKLDARSAEVQALVQSAVNATLTGLHRQAESQMSVVLEETKERASSALASLDAENRAACEARRQSIEAEVARSAERSTDQFRKSMKAFLYSCLVAAVSAVDEHSKSTMDGLTKDNGKSLHELHEAASESGSSDGPEILPKTDPDPFTH